MHDRTRCPHCRRTTTLVTPPRWARALVVLAWINAAVLVLCAGMIGPFIMLVIPPLFACGAGLISGAHAIASEPPTCGECGKIVVAVGSRVARVAPVHTVARV
jgi:hypothetical protein